MADTKISALTATSPALSTHRIPIAISPFGGGDNGYLTPVELGAFANTSAWKLASGGTLTAANSIVGTSTNTIKFQFDALAVTPVEGAGVMLANETAAAAGAQQISPSITWSGRGWKTNATAASQTVNFMADVLPVQGAANPTGTWRLRSSVNGGAYTTTGHIVVNTSGAITIGDASLGQNITFNGALIAGTYGGVANTAVNIRSTVSVAAATGAITFTNNGSMTITSGTFTETAFTGATFAATSGTGVYNVVLINNTVNQTGSASGAVTELRIAPTYTSVLGTLTGVDYNPAIATVSGTHLSIRTTSGSVLLNATTKGANTGVGGVIIGNAGTNASAAQTDGIVIHSKDASTGSANATLALYLEEAPEATATFTQTHRLKIWINGVEYYLPLDTV